MKDNIMITVPITTPIDFEFDLSELLNLIHTNAIDEIEDETKLNDAINYYISVLISGYDDCIYYNVGADEYEFIRNEAKKHIATQLTLDI